MLGLNLKFIMNEKIKKITNGKLLTTNVVKNLLGQVLPLLVALISIPMLIKDMGTERFGVLTIAWIVTGYFSIFDLGIGRAMTKLISELLGKGKEKEIPSIVWTGLTVMLVLGTIGSLLLASSSHYLSREVLSIPLILQPETEKTLYLLSVSIPIVIINSCLRGILESYQRFDLINIVRTPAGILNFIAPLFVTSFSINLDTILAYLVIVKFLEFSMNILLCIKINPLLLVEIKIKSKLIHSLFKFGGWITVSNVVGPIISYMDRFLIGSLISITAVAYYTTPYEIIVRLMIIPGAIVGVIYPAFAATIEENIDQTKKLYYKGLKYTFLIMCPIALILVTFAKEGITYWLGNEFGTFSTDVFKWLIIGGLINSLAYIPYALIQASGRPDLTAKLNLVEAPIYLVLIILVAENYGIQGVAIVWFFRVAADMLILSYLGHNLMKQAKFSINNSYFYLILIIILIISFVITLGIIPKIILIIAFMFVYLFTIWFKILDNEERCYILPFKL